MRSRMFFAVLVAAALTAEGCGYFRSGEWSDDPGNWSRAFRSTKPDDVVVVHSYYRRSPHWTYEFQYFFAIAKNAGLQQQLFTKNSLQRLEGESATRAKNNSGDGGPSWFAPGTGDKYEIWVYKDEPRGHFVVLVDKASGALFLTNYQR